jgi:hypothetical protein
MLLSDGASRFEDLFELATWEEVQALLDENGPDELLRQVRAAEAADAEGRQPDPWPTSLALSLAPWGSCGMPRRLPSPGSKGRADPAAGWDSAYDGNIVTASPPRCRSPGP